MRLNEIGFLRAMSAGYAAGKQGVATAVDRNLYGTGYKLGKKKLVRTARRKKKKDQSQPSNQTQTTAAATNVAQSPSVQKPPVGTANEPVAEDTLERLIALTDFLKKR